MADFKAKAALGARGPGNSRENALIASDVELSLDVTIHHPDLVNLYGCRIGEGTSIGAFVEIRKSVVIGRNVKIQAFVFIPEGVTVHDGVFLGPHVCFTNDRYPRAVNEDGTTQDDGDWQLEPTIVERRASIGANATILCGLTIGANAMIGAGTLVTRDVPPNAVVMGVPGRIVGDVRDSL
jgi:UDP-2-acetamido-3-amino-2,3-dideoxy-glucuronate N-acetyltransferase